MAGGRTMYIAEVLETKMAYKPGATDEWNDGKPLPLGTIKIRLQGDERALGQMREIYAYPANFSKRWPLVGEQVLVLAAPGVEYTSRSSKRIRYFWVYPFNAADDLGLHHFPKLWERDWEISKGTRNPGRILADQEEVGYTIPKKSNKRGFLQPFEGDHIIEGRHGQHIRISRTYDTVNSPGTSIYQKQSYPDAWQGGKLNDPIMTMAVNRLPSGGSTSREPKAAGSEYRMENIGSDDSSIYLTSKQRLPSFKTHAPNDEVMKEGKSLSSFNGDSQVAINSDRVTTNARKDHNMVLAKKHAVISGKDVVFQDDKYRVFLRDLMDFLGAWHSLHTDLVTARAQYSTPAGPTAFSSNADKFMTHQAAFGPVFTTQQKPFPNNPFSPKPSD